MWYSRNKPLPFSSNRDSQAQDYEARTNIIALTVLVVLGALIFGFSDNRKAVDQAGENEPVIEARVVPR